MQWTVREKWLKHVDLVCGQMTIKIRKDLLARQPEQK
jgi:hypothetical protein